MKYVKRCLVLLLALAMTAAMIRPSTTMAKYTIASDPKTLDFTLDTAQTTYTIERMTGKVFTNGFIMSKTPVQGNFTTVTEDGQTLEGYTVSEGSRYTFGKHEFGNTMINAYIETVAGIGVHVYDADDDNLENVWWYMRGQFPAGHQVYVRTNVKIVQDSDNGGLTFRVEAYNTNGNASSPAATVKMGDGNWQMYSCLLTGHNGNGELKIGGGGNSTKYEYYMSHLMVIDLTLTFGAGNEPPKWWCDKYIPWVDETTESKTVQWFPKTSMSALDTAFHDGDVGYYTDNGRANDATVVGNEVTLGGLAHVNSTELDNPSFPSVS